MREDLGKALRIADFHVEDSCCPGDGGQLCGRQGWRQTDVFEGGYSFPGERPWRSRCMQKSRREDGGAGLETIWISGLHLDMELSLWEYLASGILSKIVQIWKMLPRIFTVVSLECWA